MVDTLGSYEKLADWRNHDPRQRTTNFLLDDEPYSGPTHPMRTQTGLVHYAGVHHTAESRRLTFSSRPVIIPEEYQLLARQERIPRDALDGMFERQPMEQYIFDTTGKEVAVRTIMRERQSPFNAQRDSPRQESNLVTVPLFKSRRDRVLETVGAKRTDIATSTDAIGSRGDPVDEPLRIRDGDGQGPVNDPVTGLNVLAYMASLLTTPVKEERTTPARKREGKQPAIRFTDTQLPSPPYRPLVGGSGTQRTASRPRATAPRPTAQGAAPLTPSQVREMLGRSPSPVDE